MKLQSALEYLMTYGWAILIITIVLTAFYAIGVLNPTISTQCILPAGFACTNIYLVPNGLLTINLLQATTAPVNITSLGCNTNNQPANMRIPLNPPSNQVKLQIGGNYTFNVPCYRGALVYTGNPGASFNGYIFINYTDTITGFPHTIGGQVVLGVS